MKKLSLITAGLIAVGLVSSAHAQVVVRITGSTAFRANVNRALSGVITDSMGHNLVFDSNPTVVGATYADSASTLVFQGTIGGTANAVTVCTSFSGSEAGIASIANGGAGVTVPNAVKKVTCDDGSTVIANTPNAAADLPNTPQATYLDPVHGTASATANSDLAFADTSIAVSLNKGANVTDANMGNPVGIVQFIWMKGWNSTGDNSWNDLKNVTLPQVNVLLGAGEQPASFLTGAVGDTDTVVLMGRNKGSGTRVNVLADQNYGIGKVVQQYAIGNFSYSGAGVLTKPTAGPIGASTVANIGNDGYDSGSGVAASLNLDVTGSGYLPIAYIGLNDAATVTHEVAQTLTLNGVSYSDAAIQEGQYSYFGHEHLYYSSAASATAQAVATSLANGLPFTENGGVNGLTVASMNADRSGDTGYPAPL